MNGGQAEFQGTRLNQQSWIFRFYTCNIFRQFTEAWSRTEITIDVN